MSVTRSQAGSERAAEPAVAVLGAGNGGQCMAADLSLAGRTVIVCELPEFSDRLEPVVRRGTIRLTGAGRTGDAPVEVTFDPAEAAQRADLLNLVVPAFGQRRFFEELVPHLRNGQTLVVWAGDFGSLELREILRTRRPELELELVETNTLPYGTRLDAPGEVHLPLLAPSVVAAALPASGSRKVISRLRELWPCLLAGPDVLSVALSNPNPIVHPPGALLNVGRIQYSGGDFHMYREGITEAVARVIRGIYDEVRAVALALGTDVVRYDVRDFRTKVSIMGGAFQAPFDTVGAIGGIAGPHSIHDRYITEDLPYGLVPTAQLGDRVDVETPLIDSIITLGSSVCDRDFWTEGRTLAQLGLAELDGHEILEAARNGVARPALEKS
jgi:opine dehydrogenase